MSNSNSVFRGFFERLKSGKTLGIFLIFSFGLVVIFVIFFLVLDYRNATLRNKIDSKLLIKKEISDQIVALEKEILNTHRNALKYNFSQEELIRFEAIYSLKSTKKIFEELKKTASASGVGSEQLPAFAELLKLLGNFNELIAESLNKDGKVADIMDVSSQPADSVTSNFFFDESELGTGLFSTDLLDAEVEDIRDQLVLLQNQIQVIVDQDLKKTKESPVIIYVVFTIIIMLLILLLYRMISQSQSNSMTKLKSLLDSISMGELPDEELDNESHQEGIAETSNKLVRYLDDASQFARKIGDGDFDYKFTPKSEKDELGTSLIDMRNRLQEVAVEDKVRNWVNEGQAKFGEILRLFSNDIEILGNKIISEIVDYLDASQAALFILTEDGNKSYLELLSAYAFNRKKHIEKKIEIGEGLAGQAYEEGKSIYLTDIKTDHYHVQTGLGESAPSSLLIVPLKQEERIEGVIEIASLKELEKYQIDFVESIAASIASSLSSGKVNLTTKKLLEETQEKAEQMKAQEEELRQNMEELAATQEQMARRNKEMEDIQEQLSEERYLLNALLNSTHDRIYFKDRDSKFMRVSKSMIELFGKKSENEVLGKSDFDFGFEEHARVAFDDEQRIIKTDQPLVDAVEKEQWDDGRVTWVSTTKNPLKDLEGNIVGTFGISRDVTRSKEVELEMIKRKEWFENFFKFHPVGYAVVNQKGKISFSASSLLSEIGAESADDLYFNDMFVDKSFDKFLNEIEFDNVKDTEVELSLQLNNDMKSEVHFIVISGSNENMDGTNNIFLIQK